MWSRLTFKSFQLHQYRRHFEKNSHSHGNQQCHSGPVAKSRPQTRSRSEECQNLIDNASE